MRTLREGITRPLPKVSPRMLDALLWFYETGNWDGVGTGTRVALVDRKLVGHTRRGIKPDLIEDEGVAVLLAHGRLVHAVGDLVRERRSGAVCTVTGIHSGYIATDLGQGGVAAYLPVSKLPAVWADTTTPQQAELAEATPEALPDGRIPAQDNGLEALYTDQQLITMMRGVPLKNTRRRRAELLLQLPTPADRVEAMQQAHDGSCQVGGPDLVDALARVVEKHPRWRPVACGSRYLPCEMRPGQWGVIDIAEDVPGGIDWVTDEQGRAPLSWSSFEDARSAAAQLLANDRNGEPVGVAQQGWETSVVRVGDRISGMCVTYGGTQQGAVVAVVGPNREDCGGYRYLIHDEETGRRHTVFAELLT